MTPAAAAIACALELLGRSHAMAPIVLLPAPPAHASSTVEAFVTQERNAIYVMTSTRVFQDASSERSPGAHQEACRKLASIIVHEEWHVQHGGDERGAYLAQLNTLQVLHASWETIAVVRASMAAVVKAQRISLPR
jgi:hypothetical protein